MTDTQRREGRKILFAATGMHFFSGALYIWGVINKLLMEEGWSSKEASLPYTLTTVFFVLSMAFFGKVQDQKGPRKLATVGSILIGSGLLLSGFFKTPTGLLCGMGILTGIGIGIINVTTTPPALKWFPPEQKGRVTGTVVAGVSLSSLFYSPVANLIGEKWGSAAVFYFIGTLALICTTVLAQFMKNPPIQESLKARSEDVHSVPSRKMLKDPSFYMVWLMLALSSSSALMIIGHIAKIAEKQANYERGYLLVMLLALFNTLGRFVGGSLSDRFGRIRLLRVVFVMQTINMFLFSKMDSAFLLLIGTAVTGLCYGATFSVFPAMISDYYGLKYFGRNYGLMFTGWGIGGIIGPMAAAIVLDATSSYDRAYQIAGALVAVAFLLSFFPFRKVTEKTLSRK